MAHRVRSLVGRGVRADQILGLTFSNKAAENLRRRIVKDVDAGLDVAVSTYHGYGAGIVRDFALELGFRKSPTLIDRGTAFGLLYETLHDLEFEHRKVGRPADLVSAALRLASQCADHLVSLEAVIQNCNDLDADQTVLPEVRKAARGRRDLASIAKQFEVAKRKHGLIDFGDQIAGAVRVLEQHPEVAATLRDRHPVVLLDEYQDTNFAQRRLLQLIYPPGSPITVVGDDMQSIYAFRGAHLENLLRFDDHFVSPNSSTDTFVEATLETNYRSGSRVVSLANHVASTVDVTLPKTLRAGPTAISDHIEYALGADDDDEAHLIANWVLDRGAPWSETAILARKRKLFPVIAKALEGVGVPVEIVGIGGLLHRPEVVDTLAWLEVIALEDPNIAVLRLFRSPLRAIGMNDIALLSQHAKVRAREANPTVRYPKTSLLDAIANVDHCLHVSSEAWARCKAFGADLHHLQRIADRVRLPELLEAIFDVERLFDRCDDVGQENLLRLLDIADTFDPVVGTSTPRSFLEFLELVKASEDEPAEASATDSDAVRVMTIHQSKGLEFDNVAVAGLSGKGSSTYFPDDRMAENGATNTAVLPLWLRADNAGFTSPPRTRNALEASRAHAKNERINEERRLLYVALTRARQHLFATAAHWYGETKSPQGPSSFYELISAHNTSVERRPAADAPPESPLVRRRRERSVAVAVVNDRAITKATVAGTARGASKRRSFPTADQASLLGNAAAAEEAPANTETNVNAAPWQARSIGTKTPISATSLVSLARCKRQFEWSAVTPLPQRASRAAERGTTIHAAVASYLQASPSGRAKMNGDPIDHEGERRDGATDLLAMFASSPWPLLPLFGTEVRLAGSIGGFDVTARVDALFGSADPTKSEHLTIVDWKTTRPALVGETPNDLQLDVTAVLAVQLYRLEPEQLRTSFVHLRPNGIFEQSKEWTAELLTEARSRLEPLLHASQGPTFLEQPGPWCRRCPFEAFCPGAVVAQRQGRLL